MKIQWNTVTRVSQLVSIVLFVLVFLLGIGLGMLYERHAYANAVKAYSEGRI